MSGFLLDTHALTWWVAEPERLSDVANECVQSDHAIKVSVVSLWEIAIKEQTKRPLLGGRDARRWFGDAVAKSGFAVLPIELDHAGRVQYLPLYHGDPFDRLLIAQAQHEDLAIVSRDRQFSDYDVEVVW